MRTKPDLHGQEFLGLHVFDYVRFDGAGFRQLSDVVDESGDVISHEEMRHELLLRFGDRDAQVISKNDVLCTKDDGL